MQKGKNVILIPRERFKDLAGIPSITQVVFTWLCYAADKDGISSPSIREIADHAGVSKQTVMRHTKELVKLGFIEKYKTRNKENGGYNSNTYKIT